MEYMKNPLTYFRNWNFYVWRMRMSGRVKKSEKVVGNQMFLVFLPGYRIWDDFSVLGRKSWIKML